MESDSNEFSSLIITAGSISGNVTYNRWINGVSIMKFLQVHLTKVGIWLDLQ